MKQNKIIQSFPPKIQILHQTMSRRNDLLDVNKNKISCERNDKIINFLLWNNYARKCEISYIITKC